MKTTTFPLNHSMNRSHLRRVFLLIPLVLACFALAPASRAQCPQLCDANANTALGDGNLVDNSGHNNTAIGYVALKINFEGFSNTATGAFALFNNFNGNFNTAIGANALLNNEDGNFNTATGANALVNSIGNNNTATGSQVLALNMTGIQNTATGANALVNSTGSNNIALGFSAGSNVIAGSNNIDIGSKGFSSDANTIRVGTRASQTNTYVAGISGATVPTGVTVIVDSSGHLGTITSSARFKEAINPMDKASEAILALQPVTFRYKHDLDPEGIPQFGLVAEEVEKANPALVARDEQGKPYTVRYEAVNAMLLNEFLKEHRKVEQQRKDFETAIAKQQKQIEALTAGLQKVSAQVEASRRAQQTVVSNP